MNKKSTNRLVSILNIIIWAFILLALFISNSRQPDDITLYTMSIYANDFLIFFNKHSYFLIFISLMFVPIPNIICAIQNRKNRKLLFWYISFSIFHISIFRFSSKYNIVRILLMTVPILFALKNIIINIKNKEKKLYLISYVSIIICSVLAFLDIIPLAVYIEIWIIISAIMQLIHIHKQDTNIEIKKLKTIINIILYNIIFILVTIFLLTILITHIYVVLLWSKNLENSEVGHYIQNIKTNLVNSDSIYTGEQYLTVYKNGKWGYINNQGKEIVPCENDRQTYFQAMNVNGKLYNIALVVQDGIYKIITENNETIYSGEEATPWLNNLVKSLSIEDEWQKDSLALSSISSFSDDIEYDESDDEDTYEEENILILENFETAEGYEYKNNDLPFNILLEEPQQEGELVTFLVTTTKPNGETKTSRKYIPTNYSELYGLSNYPVIGLYNDLVIDLYSDGYIPFYDFETARLGWYDNNGNEIYITQGYEIIDIRNNIITVKQQNQENVLFLNMQGQILLQAKEVELCDNGYLIRKANNFVVYIDNNLIQKTEEFYYIEDNFENLICINITATGQKEVILLDLEGNILSKKYDDIGSVIQDESYELYNSSVMRDFYDSLEQSQ